MGAIVQYPFYTCRLYMKPHSLFILHGFESFIYAVLKVSSMRKTSNGAVRRDEQRPDIGRPRKTGNRLDRAKFGKRELHSRSRLRWSPPKATIEIHRVRLILTFTGPMPPMTNHVDDVSHRSSMPPMQLVV
jgi:hypothetical protein